MIAVLLLRLLAPVFAAQVERVPVLNWSTGHIVAISEMRMDPSTLLFEAATASRYGHMGVVAQTPEGPMVYHSMPPGVQKTPLSAFLEKARVEGSDVPQFTVVRHVDPLTHVEKDGLVAVMEDMIARKVPFNYTMAMNDRSVNCSEFVHKAFAAIGRTGLGDVGPISRSNFNAFDGELKRLFRLPPVPADAIGVSPASIVNSPQVEPVFAGLPVERLLSDAEIIRAWESGGGLDKLSQMTRIPREKLEEMARRASHTPYRAYPPTWRPPKSLLPSS
jgi:hypothetical protein